jgi:hypothetical protein
MFNFVHSLIVLDRLSRVQQNGGVELVAYSAGKHRRQKAEKGGSRADLIRFDPSPHPGRPRQHIHGPRPSKAYFDILSFFLTFDCSVLGS